MNLNRIVFFLGLFFLCTGSVSASTQEGILLYNQMNFTEAEGLLQKEANKGDSSALFWLGLTQVKTGEKFEAGKSIEKAAKLGNPWAMEALVSSWNSPCELLGWSCSESWKDLAIKKWEEQAAQGDAKALYALAEKNTDFWKKIPYLRNKKYQEIAVKGVNMGVYTFLNSSKYWDDDAVYGRALSKSISDGYAPGLVKMALSGKINSEDYVKLLIESINKGYYFGARQLSYLYENGERGLSKSQSKAYYYSELANKLTDHKVSFYQMTHIGKNESGELVELRNISKEDQKKIDQKVKAFLKKVKPNLYIDETNSILF